MNSRNLIGGLLASAAVGAVIGMLLAPASGAKTQQKLIKGARKLGDSLVETAEDSVQTLKERYNSMIRGAAKSGKAGIDVAAEKMKA